ncbi:MAG: RraA family protein [Symbiobacteriaceae bacterium]|nr:RraA family protein [Symbiobacteriaceae bacterium]
MIPNVGCRVNLDIQRAPGSLVEQYRHIPASNISDIMNRFYCMESSISPYGTPSLAGVAFTVKTPIGDNAMIHYALDLAEPGDILVVDGGAELSRALMGEIMFTYAWQKGIAGIIVDGAIRDVDCLSRLPLPVYASGVTPQGPYKNGYGEINFPVACGGQVVSPGDILIGDADGIVVIRRQDAPLLLELAQAKLSSETVRLESYREGKLDDEQHFAEYDTLLKKQGLQVLR